MAIQRDREPGGLGHVLGVIVELDLQAVGEMMALLIDYDVPARDQKQVLIALKKKPLAFVSNRCCSKVQMRAAVSKRESISVFSSLADSQLDAPYT
jgi:hypothetical protein